MPTLQLFPLLKVPERYEPNVLDILESREEREYWLDALHKLNPGLLEKAVASESVSPGAHNTKNLMPINEQRHSASRFRHISIGFEMNLLLTVVLGFRNFLK